MSFKEEIIGNCRLILGDCLEVLHTLGKVDAVVTDPPYGIGKKTGTIGANRKKNEYLSFDDSPENVIENIIPRFSIALSIATRASVTPGAKMMMKYPEPKDIGIFFQPASCGMSFWGRNTWQPILFYGDDPRLGKTIDLLHRTLTEKASCAEHPCAKPQLAWNWLVKKTSLLGETILDPFMGSGTTGVSCAKLGRKFIGIELEPKYFDIACKRVEQAYKQGDMFIEQPKVKEEQKALL